MGSSTGICAFLGPYGFWSRWKIRSIWSMHGPEGWSMLLPVSVLIHHKPKPTVFIEMKAECLIHNRLLFLMVLRLEVPD